MLGRSDSLVDGSWESLMDGDEILSDPLIEPLPSCSASNLLNRWLSDWLTMARCSFRYNLVDHY